MCTNLSFLLLLIIILISQFQGISAVVSVMDEYSLNRQDFDSINELTKFKSKGVWAADPTKELTTQVKTAFTKEANKSAQSRRVHAGFLIDAITGKKRARKDVERPSQEVAAGMEVDEGVV